MRLPFHFVENFHIDGCEWTSNYVKLYADGKLIQETSKNDLKQNWIIDKPLWLWVDTETFLWHGLPLKQIYW